MRDALMLLAGVATAALVAKVALLLKLPIKRQVFLQYIHRLVEEDMERAIKLASVHTGPVAQLTYTALVAIDQGRAASVPEEMDRRGAEWTARVGWMAWPIRIVGLAGIAGLAFLLATAPHGRKDSMFGVDAGWLGFLALLIVVDVRLVRGLVADIAATVRVMKELAHHRA